MRSPVRFWPELSSSQRRFEPLSSTSPGQGKAELALAEKQDYEVRYLAQKYGLDREQARNLIARVGNDREKLDQAARELIGT